MKMSGGINIAAGQVDFSRVAVGTLQQREALIIASLGTRRCIVSARLHSIVQVQSFEDKRDIVLWYE